MATTTSTIVDDPDGAVVRVDPAWEPDELGLAELTADRGWFVAEGLSTHAHHD